MPRVELPGWVRNTFEGLFFSGKRPLHGGLRTRGSHVVCLSAPMRRRHLVLRGDDGHGAAAEGAQRGKPRCEVYAGARPVELVCCVAQPDASSACRLEWEVKQRPRAEKAAFLLARAERPSEA